MDKHFTDDVYDLILQALRDEAEDLQDKTLPNPLERAFEVVSYAVDGMLDAAFQSLKAQAEVLERARTTDHRLVHPQGNCKECGAEVDECVLEFGEGRCDECFTEYLAETAPDHTEPCDDCGAFFDVDELENGYCDRCAAANE